MNPSDRFVRSHLKTRHLVLLVELGRHGSVVQAASAANLTQPAASKLLGEIEHGLGVQLFERLPRGVRPTWYGRVLIRRAGAALAEMDAAYQEVMELMAGMRGRVNIGSVLTPSTSLLPPAIKLLKSRHARVHVAVNVATSRALVDSLRAGECDIVIARILDADQGKEVVFEPIHDEPHGVVVGAHHPLLKRGSLDLAELARQSWIIPPAGSIVRDRLTSIFLSKGLEPPPESLSTSELPFILSMLSCSDMLAPLPLELVQPYIEEGTLALLPFDLNLRMDAYGIVTRKHHHLSPGAEAMLTALQDVIAANRSSERTARDSQRMFRDDLPLYR